MFFINEKECYDFILSEIYRELTINSENIDYNNYKFRIATFYEQDVCITMLKTIIKDITKELNNKIKLNVEYLQEHNRYYIRIKGILQNKSDIDAIKLLIKLKKYEL